MATELYCAGKESSNDLQNDASQNKPAQSSTTTTSLTPTLPKSTETSDPEIRLDVRSAAWIILALVFGFFFGKGVFKIFEALAYRIRGGEKQLHED